MKTNIKLYSKPVVGLLMMKNIMFAAIAYSPLLLGILLGTRTCKPAYATDVAIRGSYHTTVDKQGSVPANNYNNENATVTVDYDVAVKTDPKTGKKEFDLAASKVTFHYIFNGTPFTTLPVPITQVSGDPNTGKVDSFNFAGTQWDPKRPKNNNGISGMIDVSGKKGTVKSSYTSGGLDPTITSYTFATENQPPARPKRDPKTGQPFAVGTRIPANQSIDYNAETGMLSINNDKIVRTPVPSDPILGAALNFSDYQFTGFTSDRTLAIFWAGGDNSLMTSDGLFTMTKGGAIFEQSDIPVLFYDVKDNLFYAGLSDTTLNLSNISSPFLNSLESLLDPSSSSFDPGANLFLTISPDTNFVTTTDYFTASGGTGADDLHFVADPNCNELDLGDGLINVFLNGNGTNQITELTPQQYCSNGSCNMAQGIAGGTGQLQSDGTYTVSSASNAPFYLTANSDGTFAVTQTDQIQFDYNSQQGTLSGLLWLTSISSSDSNLDSTMRGTLSITGGTFAPYLPPNANVAVEVGLTFALQDLWKIHGFSAAEFRYGEVAGGCPQPSSSAKGSPGGS